VVEDGAAPVTAWADEETTSEEAEVCSVVSTDTTEVTTVVAS